MTDALILQQPEAPAQQLVLLFHGVGGSARDMVPLGRRVAEHFPTAFVVSVQAPDATPQGAGWQWFSVQGITEENRPERVEEALPEFLVTVRHWQRTAGVGVAATALIGFSQGAIMALEASAREPQVAGRVVSFAGRFARLPERATRATTLHLFHGKSDPVIPYAQTIAATEHVLRLGGDVTADVLPFVGHEINEEMQGLLIERLTGYIPRHCWDEALRAECSVPLQSAPRRDH